MQVHVLAMLDHPNIIGYYDSFEEDGIMMIEMEYADGGWDLTVCEEFSSCKSALFDSVELVWVFDAIVNSTAKLCLLAQQHCIFIVHFFSSI